MQWSKLKQRSEQRMADTLHGRIELHAARYTHAHDGDGRGWITVDKREIVNFYDFRSADEWSRLQQQHPYSEARRQLLAQGQHSRMFFYQSLEAWLSMSVTDALTSDDVVVRAMAMTDRRLGKRRLRAMQFAENDHPLVCTFHALRCDVENIRPTPTHPESGDVT